MLIGSRVAIVPLGISCQTAFQIERALPLLAERLDQVFSIESTPFDWRIVGPNDIGVMIQRGRFYPPSADQIEGTKRPYWPEFRCHFWHDGAGDFEAFKSKQSHLVDNWQKIHLCERKVFVLSNIQSNLPDKARDPGGFEYQIGALELRMLAMTLAEKFKRPELHIVTRRELVKNLELFGTEAKLTGVRFAMHFVKETTADWRGDARVWDGALTAITG